jgi:hypothetical protein
MRRNAPGPTVLDGTWRVRRLAGLLPPLVLVRKEITGAHGRTTAGRLSFPFDVHGSELRYRAPLRGLVDAVESDGADRLRGEARLFGRVLGSFLMIRE